MTHAAEEKSRAPTKTSPTVQIPNRRHLTSSTEYGRALGLKTKITRRRKRSPRATMVGDFDSDSGGACGTPKQIWVGLLAGAAKAPDVRRHDAKPEGWRSAKVSSAGAPAAQPMRNHFCSESNTPPPRAVFAAASRSAISAETLACSSSRSCRARASYCGTPEANLVGLLAGAAKAPDVRRPDE